MKSAQEVDKIPFISVRNVLPWTLVDVVHQPMGNRTSHLPEFRSFTHKYRPEDDSQITFSCNGKQGALLSLPVPAQGQDTVAFGDFGKWMIKHIDTWFAFARALGLGINRMEDIILVTGRHLTKSWVNVAFTQRRPDAGVSFDVQVSGHSHVSLEQEYVRGGDLKLGPTGRVWIYTVSRFRRILKLLGHDLARTRIYREINAYLFEDSVSSASSGCGPSFVDRQDLLQMQATKNLNLNPTHTSNS
jgi:hypothetical protein